MGDENNIDYGFDKLSSFAKLPEPTSSKYTTGVSAMVPNAKINTSLGLPSTNKFEVNLNKYKTDSNIALNSAEKTTPDGLFGVSNDTWKSSLGLGNLALSAFGTIDAMKNNALTRKNMKTQMDIMKDDYAATKAYRDSYSRKPGVVPTRPARPIKAK